MNKKTISMNFVKLNQYEKYRNLSLLSVILYNEFCQRRHKSATNTKRKLIFVIYLEAIQKDMLRKIVMLIYVFLLH